ncbi:MAG: hypothetical protein IKP64_01895 [Selenomonadaceae bacterium]|nr:hypothetical protein [Selenomonadaceae bacterium]MBR4382288.1 hypothetical protein [Selenomonadaceae bacterium]
MADQLTDRINSFLYEVERVEDADVTAYVTQIAAETGLTEDDVQKVINAVLKILEQKRIDNGIIEGQAFPAYIVNHHAFKRRFWGRQ